MLKKDKDLIEVSVELIDKTRTILSKQEILRKNKEKMLCES